MYTFFRLNVDPMKLTIPVFVLSTCLLAYAAVPSGRRSHSAPPVDFGRDIKPILSQKCFKCHGPDASKAAAGLRLDLFDGATKKLRDGFAIVPGKPIQSKLLERVSSTNEDMRMPPPDSGATPLTKEQIATMEAWITQGAKYAKHWSFVPPAMPKSPGVKDSKWCRNPIDGFVLAKLEEAGLKPETQADRHTLALRAAEVLTGLPPTKAELDSYLQDKSSDAYERYVDRQMQKTAYGEQQARYWLDAVRYGDTHGLQLDNERAVYPYRDWVIEAFNKDLPFDKFLLWQLAGDLLPSPTTEQMVATGYVRMNLTSNEGGAIAEEFLARNTFDRVETTGTVLLGLTIGCARCHDHKFDPIKQKDYYGLYAYFNSTQDQPLDGNIALPPPFIRAPSSEQTQRLRQLEADLGAVRKGINDKNALVWLTANRAGSLESKDWQISPVMMAKSFDEAFDKPGPGEPGHDTTDWKPLKFQVGKDHVSLVGKDNAAVYVKGTVVASKRTKLIIGVSSDDAVKVWLNGKLIHANKVSRGVDQAIDKVVGTFNPGPNELIAKVINGSGPDGLNIRLTDERTQRIIDTVDTFNKQPSPINHVAVADTYLEVGPDTPLSKRYRAIKAEQKVLMGQIPMSLIAKEMTTPRPTFILKRGQYDQPGDPVQRHVPSALGELTPKMPNDRLGLAKWMISPSNPLVARVFVNRVWQQSFGTGIVKTSEDFGSQGELPVNQPLLDYLAVQFAKKGWSVKQLNRQIVTSAAFRQASRVTPLKLVKDPENRLISRGPRFRLDAEEIRDKALFASGLLSDKIGGHGFKPYQPDGLWEGSSDPASSTHFYVRDRDNSIYRRSMYMFWKRTSPPPVMVTFDSPTRDTCIVRRSVTNTPLQALTTLNETAFLEASRVMAQHLTVDKLSDEAKMTSAFRRTLAREPEPWERKVMMSALARYRRKYLGSPKAAHGVLRVGDATPVAEPLAPETASWMLVCSSLMNTDEFLSLH